MGDLSIGEIKAVKILILQAKGLEKTIDQILNSNSQECARYGAFKQMAVAYNDLVERAKGLVKTGSVYTFNTETMRGSMDTPWTIQKQIMEMVLLYTRMLISVLEDKINFVGVEIENIENFIESNLRNIIFEIPKKEKEVQNSIEALFIGKGYKKGINYDRETGKFNYSGREYIPDFILPKLRMCIEIKLLNEVSKKSKVIEEINADIPAYLKNYNNILFVVYDLGVIRDKLEFSRDIESNDGVHIVIVKH